MKDEGPRLLVLPHLDRWVSQWDQLVDLSPIPSPFLRSWWLIGAGEPQLRFLLVVEDDRLLGGLALQQGHRLGLPCLQMMGDGPLCPDHLDLLARTGQEDAVVKAVGDWLRRPGARILDLEGIRAGSRLITALPGRVRCEPLAIAPWVPLPVDVKVSTTGFGRTLRRASSRLTAEGATYRINRGASSVRSLVAFRQLHTAQWGDSSRFLPGWTRFAAACRLAADVDEVAVHELAAGKTVIAIVIAFEVAGRVSLYQSARLTDSRWRDATMVLLATIIADARDRGFTEVDFLRGDEAYKDNFAPQRRELLRLRAASGRTGRAVLVLETAARTIGLQAARSVRGWGRVYERHTKTPVDRSPVSGPLSPLAGLPCVRWRPRSSSARAWRVPWLAWQPPWPNRRERTGPGAEGRDEGVAGER